MTLRKRPLTVKVKETTSEGICSRNYWIILILMTSSQWLRFRH
jgi:hypothetical protein